MAVIYSDRNLIVNDWLTVAKTSNVAVYVRLCINAGLQGQAFRGRHSVKWGCVNHTG